MGTEVHSKNLFPGYYSMRNVNEDSTSTSWHLFNAFTNGDYYDGFTSRTVTDAYFGRDKDELKQKILQHEAVFKNQVNELHRLYRRQRDIMEEVKRKEFNKFPVSIDTSSSSSLMTSQKPYEDADRWQNPSFRLGKSNNTSRPSIFGAEISNSPLSSKGNGSKECEVVECRPSKVRKKLFDLQLPGHEYVDLEESQHIVNNHEISSCPAKANGLVTKNGVKTFLDDVWKKDDNTNTVSGQHSMRTNGLADLNEPVYSQDVDFLGPSVKPERFSNLPFEGQSNGRNWFSSCLREPENSGGNMQHLHSKEFQHRVISSEISSKIQDHSRFNPPRLIFNGSSAYPFASTPGVGNSLTVKSTDSLTHKLTSFQKQASFLSSPNNHEVFRDKWHNNGNGSSSGSKELPARLHSVGFSNQNRISLDNGSQKILKGSNFIDLTGTIKDMDLNTVQILPNGDDNSRKCDHSGDLSTNKKLLGFPIFGNFCVTKTDDSPAVSTSASVKHREIDINVTWNDDTENQIDVKTDVEIKNFKNHFDLNYCVTEDDDELLVMESVKSLKKTTMEIDLEAPAVSEIMEEEEEEEDDEHKEIKLELKKLECTELENIAVEAIIAISSQQNDVDPTSKSDDDNNDDPLLWFMEVIDFHETKLASATREMDDYETLTLQLEEIKEADYMPVSLVPEFQEPDEVGPTCRPRRGQARRGRPRRDFQRDVLPGMTSLSRHEITEDLQIFGGLMKATGHSWVLGSTKRNRRIGARGRPKAKTVETRPASTAPPPPLSKHNNSVEAVGLDERSLIGWGKTTRRPRRQRCAVNNSVAVRLT